jgi:hypothetical protein
LFATLLAIFGATFTATGTASASTDYGMNMDVACHYTYGGSQYGAAFYSPTNPFSWVCRHISFNTGSFGMIVDGGVDMQKYCSITYPGSRAVIVSWNVWGWRCRR